MIELIYPSETYAQLIPRPSAADTERALEEKSAPREEMLPVVQENGMVVGMSARSYCHGGSKVLHPVVHLHIIDRYGHLCLQKRSMSKKIQPGRWDTAVGGHVSYGESIREALYRESFEELSFREYNPIYMGTYTYESEIEKELVFLFAAVGNFKLNGNPEEIDEVRFWTPEEIAQAPEGTFTPMFTTEYAQLKDSLFALL